MKKKIATLIISTSIILSSTIANAISDIQEFTDYNTLSTHWGLQDIQTLVLKGGIKGIPNDDGTFRFEPNRSITTAELLSIILNTSGNAPTSTDWPMNVMNKAIDLKIIPSKWVNDGNVPITRERMAGVLGTTWQYILKEDINKADYAIDKSKITDLNESDGFEDYIVMAYERGLVGGNGDGTFNPKGETTRAECCAVINRLFNYTSRVDNSALSPTTSSSTGNSEYIKPGEGCYGGVISQYPIEGDVINGITVTRDPETGVLGYGNGQKGGIYLGVAIGNTGRTIQVGTESPSDIYDGARGNKNANGYYEQRGDYVYWNLEWMLIEGNVTNKLQSSYPNMGTTTCADIYGNILEGVTDINNKDVFFYFDTGIGLWTPKAWY